MDAHIQSATGHSNRVKIALRFIARGGSFQLFDMIVNHLPPVT